MNPISIRTLTLDDAPRLLEFERENRAWFERHVDPRGDIFYSIDGVRDQIAQYLEAHARSAWHPNLLLDQKGAIVGRANLKDIDLAAGVAEVGCRIAQSQVGNGLATTALEHLIELARSQWQLNRLVAFVSSDNFASARVLEKCGFVQAEYLENVGTVRGAPVHGHRFSLELR